MKVTVVFEDFKVVVPCNKKKQVRKLMEDAVIRYNRITNKKSPHIKTLCLQGGGILDPDDVIADVIDDAEEVWAVCDIRVETIMNNINNNHVDDNNNNNNNNLIYNNKNNEINNNNNNNNKKDNKENCQVKNEVNNNSYFENINQIDDRNNKEDKNIDEINANSNENYGKNYLYANDTKINSNQNMKAELHKNSTTFLEDNGKAKFEFKKNFTEVNHSHNHSFENTYTHTSEHQNDAVNIVTNDDSIERVKMHSNITTNAHDGTNTKIHTDIEARDIKSQSLLSHMIFSNDFDTIYSNVDKKTTNSNKTDMNHIGVSNNLDDGLRHESAQTNVLDEYCVSVTQEDFLKESSLKCKTLSDPELFKSGGDVDAYEQQTDENNNHIDLYGNKQSGKNSGIDENEKYDLSISKYLIGQHKEHEEGEGGKKGKEGKGMKDHQFGVFTDYSEDDEEDDEDEDDDENLLFLFQSDERNAQIVNLQTDGRPIGLHVRPLFVNKRQEKIRGLEVRWKETNTVAERETNINVGDIIIEVNNISLFNVPASMAKEIFKDAMERSEMRLKVLCVERQVLHKSMKDLRDPSDTKEIFNPAFKSVSLSDMNNTLYNNNNNNFNNKNNDFNNNNNIINANELYTSKNYDSNEVVHNIGVDSYSPVNLPDYDLYNHLNKNNMNNKNDKINNNNNNNNFITSQVGDDNVFAVKERYVYDLPDNVYRHINNNNNQNNKNNNNNNNKISRSESLIKAMDKCLEDSPVYAVPTSIKKNKPRWWSRLIQKKKKGKGEATVTKEASSQTDKTVFKQNHNNVQNRKNDNNNNNNMSNKNISNINNIPNNNLYNYKTNIKNNVNNIKNNNKYGNNANNYNNNNNMNDNNNAYYNNNNNNNNDNNNNNTPYIVKNTIEETIRSNDIVQVENESGNKVYDKNGKNTNTLNTNNTKADDDLINYNNTNENFVKSDFSNKENSENVNFLNLNYIINNNDNNNQNNNNNSSRNNNNKKINDNNDIINNHKINTSFSDGTNRNTYISNRDNDDYRVDSNKNIKVEKNININKTNGSSNTNNITNNNNNNNKDSIKNTSNIIKMHNTNNDVREIQKDVALNSQAKINQHRSNKSELKSDVQGKTFKISQNIFDEVKNPTKESYRPLNPPGINDCNSSKSIKTGGNCSNFTYNNYQQQQRVQNVFSNHNFALSKQQLPEKERQLPHQNQNQHIIHYQQSQNQQQTQHQWQQPYKQQNSKQKPQQTVKSLKQLNTKSTKQQEYLEADSDSHQHMRQESDGIFYQGSYSYNPKNNKSFGAISKRRINDVNNSSGSQAYDVKLKSKSALNLTEQLREKLQNSNNKQEGTRSFNLANKQLQNYTKQNILTKNISSYSQQPQNTSHNKYEKPMYNNHLHTNVHNNAFKNPNLPNDRPLSDQFYFDQPISDYFQTDRPISDQLRSHYPFKLDSYSKEIEKQNKIKRNTKQHQQKMTHQNQQKDLRQHPQQHHLSKEAFYRSAETDLLMKQTSQQIQQTKQQIKMLQQQQLLRQSKYK